MFWILLLKGSTNCEPRRYCTFNWICSSCTNVFLQKMFVFHCAYIVSTIICEIRFSYEWHSCVTESCLPFAQSVWYLLSLLVIAFSSNISQFAHRWCCFFCLLACLFCYIVVIITLNLAMCMYWAPFSAYHSCTNNCFIGDDLITVDCETFQRVYADRYYSIQMAVFKIDKINMTVIVDIIQNCERVVISIADYYQYYTQNWRLQIMFSFVFT